MKDLIEVFNDTQKISKSFNESETTKHNFSEIIMPHLVQFKNHNAFFQQFNIKVDNSDSVSTLTKFAKDGKTCVLNMASYKRPGGGVARGARAQEECLFRCSNLSEVISQDFYPLEDNTCLYTKDAVFFKDFNYYWMDAVTVDVITIAALRLSATVGSDGIPNYEPDDKELYENLTKNKIRLMISMAAKNGVKNIILGAWGCGVFNNDPQTMANYFKEILIGEGYSSYFDNVIFAIINDHNSVGNNFEIFDKTFNG